MHDLVFERKKYELGINWLFFNWSWWEYVIFLSAIANAFVNNGQNHPIMIAVNNTNSKGHQQLLTIVVLSKSSTHHGMNETKIMLSTSFRKIITSNSWEWKSTRFISKSRGEQLHLHCELHVVRNKQESKLITTAYGASVM